MFCIVLDSIRYENHDGDQCNDVEKWLWYDDNYDDNDGGGDDDDDDGDDDDDDDYDDTDEDSNDMQGDDENDSSCGGGVGTVRTAVHFNRTSWFYKSGQQLLLLLCGNIARLADYYMSLSPNCLPNGCV